VLSLVPRLVAFDVPSWRDPDAIRRLSERLVRQALSSSSSPSGPDAGVLIAEDPEGAPLGFIHVESAEDFFSGRPQGYVANLAIEAAAEGRGVGRALMEAAEAWTRARGMGELTLYVFAHNQGARAFYERLGFAEDSLKLVRTLGD
jgi:GNAT superfamily N-acetyltransferase